LEASSLIESDPSLVPAPVGVNATRYEHELRAASVVAQLPPGATANSPVIVGADKLSTTIWLFVRFTVFVVEVVPITWFENERPVTDVVAGCTPFPVNATCWGVVDASSLIQSAALRLPNPVGVKATLYVQLLAGASVLVQLPPETAAKSVLPVTVGADRLSTTAWLFVTVTFFASVLFSARLPEFSVAGDTPTGGVWAPTRAIKMIKNAA
jgi:hypothetical protein